MTYSSEFLASRYDEHSVFELPCFKKWKKKSILNTNNRFFIWGGEGLFTDMFEVVLNFEKLMLKKVHKLNKQTNKRTNKKAPNLTTFQVTLSQ